MTTVYCWNGRGRPAPALVEKTYLAMGLITLLGFLIAFALSTAGG